MRLANVSLEDGTMNNERETKNEGNNEVGLFFAAFCALVTFFLSCVAWKRPLLVDKCSKRIIMVRVNA